MARKRQFKFSVEATLVSVLALLICYSLSYWQFTRYQGKRAYEEAVALQADKPRVDIHAEGQEWERLHHAKVRSTGVFQENHTVVLINRSHENNPGVKVITPLLLEGSDQAVLVDRGFLPYNDYVAADRKPSSPAGLQQVEGILRPTQKKAFFLSPPEAGSKEGTRKTRWLRLQVDRIGENLPYKVLPFYLVQTNQPDGYPVYVPKEVVSAGRHLNYTIQWASFGTFALFLGLFVQYRPKKIVRTSHDHEIKETVPS